MKKYLLIALASLAPLTSGIAQVNVVEASFLPTEVDLSLRLEPGSLWRQQVQFQSELITADGKRSLWTFNYKLRFRCLDVRDGIYSVDGKFVDWMLRLETDDCRYEWHDGIFQTYGEVVPEDGEITDGCRSLLFAWSAGLRMANLRFDLDRGGNVTRLSGLDKLRMKVSRALVLLPEGIPQDLLEFFGQDGLERADCALAFGLSVPRPVGLIKPGAAWEHSCEVGGIIDGLCQVNREFRYSGTGQERRHRFALVELSPSFKTLNEKGEWVEIPVAKQPTTITNPNYLRVLIDSGLTYGMRLSLLRSDSDGRLSRFQIDSNFVE